MIQREGPESPDGSFWVEWVTETEAHRGIAGLYYEHTAYATSQLGGYGTFVGLSEGGPWRWMTWHVGDPHEAGRGQE